MSSKSISLSPSRRGALLIERTAFPVAKGQVGLRQRFSGAGSRVIVAHDAALVAQVRVREGSVWFGNTMAPSRFVLSVPPRSVVQIRFECAVVDSEGLGRMGAFRPGAPELRESVSDSLDDVFRGPSLLSLDPDARVAAPLVRARATLHESLGQPAPVRAAAEATAMSADMLARSFERAYGINPKQYCTRARLFDAAISLFTGAPIMTAAFASGFNDLSRFYAQFRRVLRSTPGAYAQVGKRQDLV